jgi:regulator of sirC expression with transglutaminase-like and TPR domain
MNPTESFTRAVRRPEAEIALDEAALLIAEHDHELDLEGELSRLDRLADAAGDDVEPLARFLFVEQGFVGNELDYGDPHNSYLDSVLRRRVGLPITLSVLLLEIGRRRDVALHGVGMPGHFLVGTDDGRFVDPFHRGALLDEAGCRAQYERLRPGAPWHPSYLEPVGRRAIIVRILANLVHTLVERSPADAAWALRLRLAVPGVAPGERRDAAALLGTLGRFREAASALDELADELDDASATRAREDAARLRARAN